MSLRRRSGTVMAAAVWVQMLGISWAQHLETVESSEGLQQAVEERTVIMSRYLEMQGTEDQNYFYFEGEVSVTGNNLELRCDRMTIIAARAGDYEAGIGEMGAVESIVAEGNVQILQSERRARAGRAEVDPVAGIVTLSENPVVIQDDVEISGYQFIFEKETKKFRSIPDPNAPLDQPSRSVVSLSALPDLGFRVPTKDIEVTERMKTNARVRLSDDGEPIEEEADEGGTEPAPETEPEASGGEG